MKLRSFFVLAAFVLPWVAEAAVAPPSATPSPAARLQRPMRFSLETSNVEITNSFGQPGAVPIPLSATNQNLELINWTSAPARSNHLGLFEIRMKRSIYVGSIITYGAATISYGNKGMWKDLASLESTNRQFRVTPFPPEALLDAIRLTAPAHPIPGQPGQWQAVLPFCTLIPVRALNIAPLATLTVSSTAPPPPDKPQLYRAEMLVDGQLEPATNFLTAPRDTPISTNAAEWVQLTWKDPQKIRGLAVYRGTSDPGLGDAYTEHFSGDGEPGPGTTTNGWSLVEGRATAQGQFGKSQWVVFLQTLHTRGLRIRSVGGVPQMGVGEVVILNDLGFDPLPAPPASRGVSPPAPAAEGSAPVIKP